jgi:phosphinothricin tripeptide acetyl hydrolase
MPSPELKTIVDMFSTMNPLGGGSIEAIRAGMEQAPVYPRPDDIRWEPVDAGGVPAEWTTPADLEPGRTIVYYHGGGYAIGGIEAHHGLCSNLARACRARVLNVGYRLAPEHPHPAALDDALTAYRFAISQGCDPAKLAVGGDSAGGGLTLATLLALRDAGDPLPAAGLCLSPWVDMSMADPSIDRVEAQDPMLSRAVLELFRDAYLGDQDRTAPSASPLFGKLEGLPPLLIQVGTAEVLVGEGQDFARRARDAGVDVSLEVWDDMIHVWQTFADMLPEGREAIADIGKFVEARL